VPSDARHRLAAWAADALTFGRAVVAVVLPGLMAAGKLDAAAVLLACAWCSDALDGRLARVSAGDTRLHGLDLVVDTAVGVGVLGGLVLAGHAPPLPVALAVVALGAAFLATGVAALGMGLQAIAYVWFMATLWAVGAAWRWLPPSVVVALLVLEFERFTTVVAPGFITGVATLGRRAGQRRRP
jgi:phosphatidylglycerophosphate synthase